MITRRSILNGLTAGVGAIFITSLGFSLPKIVKENSKQSESVLDNGINVDFENKIIHVTQNMTVHEFIQRVSDWFDLPQFMTYEYPIYRITNHLINLEYGYELGSGSDKFLSGSSIETNTVHWMGITSFG